LTSDFARRRIKSILRFKGMILLVRDLDEMAGIFAEVTNSSWEKGVGGRGRDSDRLVGRQEGSGATCNGLGGLEEIDDELEGIDDGCYHQW
jgi:hypothetical protein